MSVQRHNVRWHFDGISRLQGVQDACTRARWHRVTPSTTVSPSLIELQQQAGRRRSIIEATGAYEAFFKHGQLFCAALAFGHVERCRAVT